jgi:UDP-N-acetylmuramoylalanine--D-glutamate ligase
MEGQLTGRRVLIVGMGKSGIAATQALLKLGAKVTVQDIKKKEDVEPNLIQFLEGVGVTCYFGRKPDPQDTFDLVVLSPGVPLYLDFIEEAKEKGAEIVGELEIAFRVGAGLYVAITGTNGKTTTTTLVGEIFKRARRKTYVVGNIGVAVISRALIATKDTWLVTEVSSFQLETTKTFRPLVSAILNITEDHMDRHQTMENYISAKGEIFKNQEATDYTILNYDDGHCRRLGETAPCKVVYFSRKEELPMGCFLRNGVIMLKDLFQREIPVLPVEELLIPGNHNIENALAATAVAFFSGIDPEVIRETLKQFGGVEHRLEFVEEVDGIRFINDSKATNPDSTMKAVDAMPSGIVLIAGGYDKGNDFGELIDSFAGKVKGLVLLGKTASKIKETAESKGIRNIKMAKDMDESVRLAYEMAGCGDTVLLSPACASWDMYSNFEQRGEHFKTLVHKLAN